MLRQNDESCVYSLRAETKSIDLVCTCCKFSLELLLVLRCQKEANYFFNLNVLFFMSAWLPIW